MTDGGSGLPSSFASSGLLSNNSSWLGERLRDAPPPSVWDDAPPPPHLTVSLRVVDAAGRELGCDDARIAKLRAAGAI